MTLALPALPGTIILSMEYDLTGLAWVRLYDNEALGWVVEEITAPAADARAAPIVTGVLAPIPIIVGSLAKKAPDTSPVYSPQWCKFVDPAVFVPDLTRMGLHDFLTALATNNGAHRVLQAHFAVSQGLKDSFAVWADIYPDLVFEGEPPI